MLASNLGFMKKNYMPKKRKFRKYQSLRCITPHTVQEKAPLGIELHKLHLKILGIEQKL
jgi:hypothetical protein